MSLNQNGSSIDGRVGCQYHFVGGSRLAREELRCVPMNINLLQTVALLSRTPATLNALLCDLPDFWTLSDEGQGTWTAFDIVGHLIHAEHTDWIPRATMILRHGESQTFKPFDREGQQQKARGKSLINLLDEFATVRGESLVQLRAMNLQPPDLDRRGRHPAFGSVTLGQLLST